MDYFVLQYLQQYQQPQKLINYLAKHNIDIMVACKTFLKPDQTFHISNEGVMLLVITSVE